MNKFLNKISKSFKFQKERESFILKNQQEKKSNGKKSRPSSTHFLHKEFKFIST